MICGFWLGSAERCEPGAIEESVKYLTPHASHASLGTPGVVVHKQTEGLQCLACWGEGRGGWGWCIPQVNWNLGMQMTVSRHTFLLHCRQEGWIVRSQGMDGSKVAVQPQLLKAVNGTSVPGALSSKGMLMTEHCLCSCQIFFFLFLGVISPKVSLPSRFRWEWEQNHLSCVQQVTPVKMSPLLP